MQEQISSFISLIIEIGGNIINSEIILTILLRVSLILLVLIFSHFIIVWGLKLIESFLRSDHKKYLSRRKQKTLGVLMKSVLRYVVYFIAFVIILSLINIPVTSLLAGAGIIGVAIGFGSQNIIQDILHGFFILFEDQFGVGDYIKTSQVEGIVEEIGIRITSIRDFNGELHIIPNGQIDKVTNYCTGPIRVLVDVNISYEEKIDPVHSELEKLCSEIGEEKKEVITEGPTVMGVQELASSGVVIRLMCYTKPMEQWQTARYIRKRVKETLTASSIEIAYPHLVVQQKEKKGDQDE